MRGKRYEVKMNTKKEYEMKMRMRRKGYEVAMRRG